MHNEMTPKAPLYPNEFQQAKNALIAKILKGKRTGKYAHITIADQIKKYPDCIYGLRPVTNRFHSDVVDELVTKAVTPEFKAECKRLWQNLVKKKGLYLSIRTKKRLAANAQVFLYLLQNKPRLAKKIVPFRKPQKEALELVRRRLWGPVVPAKAIKPLNYLTGCAVELVTDVMLQNPNLIATLAPIQNEADEKFLRAVCSNDNLPVFTAEKEICKQFAANEQAMQFFSQHAPEFAVLKLIPHRKARSECVASIRQILLAQFLKSNNWDMQIYQESCTRLAEPLARIIIRHPELAGCLQPNNLDFHAKIASEIAGNPSLPAKKREVLTQVPELCPYFL